MTPLSVISIRRTAATLFLSGILTACNSGGSSTPADSTAADTSGEPSTTEPTASAPDADTVKTTAANAFGNTVDTAVTGIQRLTEDTISETPLVQSVTANAVRTALALDDQSGTTQNNDNVSIDPDEQALCATLIADEVLSESEAQACQQLLSDLAININATDATTGTTTYSFQDTTIMTHRYASASESLALNLTGLKRLSDAKDALDPTQFGMTQSPAVFDGVLTVSATASNQTQGSEIATMAIAVTSPITISDLQTQFTLNNGELFSLNVDNTTGNGNVTINVGAISASGPFRDNDTLDINLQGITATADIADDGDQLQVSNLGLGNGPLVFRINSVEALRLTMETFGFTVTAEDTDGQSTISIDRTMDIALMLNNMMGLDEEASRDLTQMLSLAAPAGTVLQPIVLVDESGDGASGYKLTTGGPLTFSRSVTDTNESSNLTTEITAGECFASDELSGSGSASSAEPLDSTDQSIDNTGDITDPTC